MASQGRVVVAMSGGVDSSVAAALLQQQGFDVIGMMLRLWSEPGREEYNRCCTPAAMAMARRVAAQLGIPFYPVDAQATFHDVVVKSFIDGYTQGITPNPCLACNREIRWGLLLNHALALGADYMATGHYARLRREPSQPVQLLRAVDHAKDQSYILSVLTQEQLRHALFPVGEYTKHEIRQIAQDLNLPVAQSKESQDLCFLAGNDYASFLKRNAPTIEQPGPIFNRAGEILGEHEGLAFYTIGQRKGLGITAPLPLYVLEKERAQNALIVGTADELGSRELLATGVNWQSGTTPTDTFRAEVKIRYTAKPMRAEVTPRDEDTARVVFNELARDITPGQVAVFYQDDLVIGGGVIYAAESSSESMIPLSVLQAAR